MSWVDEFTVELRRLCHEMEEQVEEMHRDRQQMVALLGITDPTNHIAYDEDNLR